MRSVVQFIVFFSFLSVHIYFCPYVYIFAMNFGGIPSLAFKRCYRIVGFTLFAMTLTVGLLVIAWLKVGRYNNFSKHIYTLGMWQFTTQPTSEEYTSICRALVQEFPVLKDTHGNGYVSCI